MSKVKKTVQNIERNDCRWPIGDPGSPDFHFCAKAKKAGHPSYCSLHAKQAINPRPLRQVTGVVEQPSRAF